jgi:hypothetical protein
MPLWSQHLLVVALVAFAILVVVRQAVGTLRMKHGKLGSCCAKGCGQTQPKSTTERIVFLPVESLKRHRNN